MKRDACQFMAECRVCQKQKYEATSPAGLLQPLAIPEAIWEDLAMDFITGLPKSKGHDVILVLGSDRSTVQIWPLHLTEAHPYTASLVAEVFIKDVVKLHGFRRR